MAEGTRRRWGDVIGVLMRAASVSMTIWICAAGCLAAPASGAEQTPAAAPANERLALVVGNAAYPSRPLATSANDAGLVAASLAQVGFDVTAATDADRDRLAQTVAAFAAKLEKASPKAIVVVYLAGYGLQADGRNMVVPIDASIEKAGDIPLASVAVDDLLKAVETARVGARLILLDLARATPFATQGPQPAGGLALVSAPAGEAIGFNTAPGAVAPADQAPYGTYARALAEMVHVPGLTADSLLERLRLRVMERTNGAAVPWSDGHLGEDVRLTPLAAVASASPTTALAAGAVPTLALPAPANAADAFVAAVARDTFVGYVDFLQSFGGDPLAGRVRTLLALRREALTWGDAMRINVPRAYWTYMRRYPRGPHLLDARHRLEALHAPLDPPPRFDVVDFDGLPPPPGEELPIVDHGPVDLKGPGDAVVPPVPATRLPAANEAFFEALPMPLVSPIRTLPAVMPYAAPIAGIVEGTIDQPDVPDLHGVTTSIQRDSAGRAVLAIASAGRTLLTATAVGDASKRTIAEATPSGGLVAKTDVQQTGARLTITQSGPDGAILLRSVSEPTSGGGHTIVLTDARASVVSRLAVSGRGVILDATAGPTPPRAAQFVYVPPPPPPASPTLAKPPAAAKQPATKPAELIRVVALATLPMGRPKPVDRPPSVTPAIPSTLPPLPPLDLPPVAVPSAIPPTGKAPAKAAGTSTAGTSKADAGTTKDQAQGQAKDQAKETGTKAGKAEAKETSNAAAASSTAPQPPARPDTLKTKKGPVKPKQPARARVKAKPTPAPKHTVRRRR